MKRHQSSESNNFASHLLTGKPRLRIFFGIFNDSICEICYHIFCSFGESNGSTGRENFNESNKSATSRTAHNSESEDDQPKKNNYDMKLTVNLDRLEVMLSRRESRIVGAIIEGKNLAEDL